MSNLSKSLIKKFSISYSEASRLGITDEDLKYISETTPNKYRVSVPNPVGKRKTKVVYDLLDAIHTKYDFIKEIQEGKKEYEIKNETLKEAKGKITRYNLIRDGIELYIKERYKDYERGFIQITTYEQDLFDYHNSKILLDSGIFDKVINDVDSEYAQKFVDYLWDLKTKNGKKMAENTIYKPFSFIRKIFNYYAKDLKIIQYNPFDNVKNKPHAKSDDKDYFTKEEIHFIKDKIDFENIRLRTLITLILDSGFRREEALAIKYSDINNLRQTISVDRAFVKSKIDNRYIIKAVKRKKSEREIICTNYSLELIEKYRQFKIACGFKVNDNDFVFTGWDSMDIIDPDAHSKEFKRFLDKIEIKKKIPLKNLRHTHATFFVSEGKNPKAIQKRVGHADITTTLDIYAQSDLNEDRKLVNAFEEEFYNKLGLSLSELYRIVSDRFNNEKKLIDFLEKICNVYIDDSNFDLELNRCKDYLIDQFPIFSKILKIDPLLNDDDIDSLFVGFTPMYRSIKIEPLEPHIKI